MTNEQGPLADQPDLDTLLVALARGAEDTATVAVQKARELMSGQKFLLHTQHPVVQAVYDKLLTELHRIRVQCFLQDARSALYGGNARFVTPLLDACTASLEHSFAIDASPSADENDTMLQRRTAVLDSIADLHSLASSTSTVTDECTIEDVNQYRKSLPRLSYTEL